MAGSASDSVDPIDDVAKRPYRPPTIAGAASMFHKLEITYVLVTLALVSWHVLRINCEVALFATIWLCMALGCAALALLPRVPWMLHLFAELSLLVIALGQYVGPCHQLLPMLGRETRAASRWNAIPLTDRRILSWNIAAGFIIAWLAVPIAFYRRRGPLSLPARVVGVLFFAVVWGMLGYLFFVVVQMFFEGW